MVLDYIFLFLMLLLFLLILPIRINLIYGDHEKAWKLYIGRIKIKTFSFGKNNKNKSKSENKNKKKKKPKIKIELKNIIEMIKIFDIRKLNLRLGINTGDVILNAYSIVFINTLIHLFLTYKYDRLKKENVFYETYLSNSLYKLEIDCIIQFRLVNTISIILKMLYHDRKVEKENGKNRTSNRFFNAYSNDIY